MERVKAALSVLSAQGDPMTLNQRARKLLASHVEEHKLGGATTIIRPDLPTVAANSGYDNPVRIDWPGGSGRVVKILAGTRDGAVASLNAISMRLQINGKEIVRKGNSGDAYVPIMIFRDSIAGDIEGERNLKNFLVSPNDAWEIWLKNESATGPLAPWIAFLYVADTQADRGA